MMIRSASIIVLLALSTFMSGCARILYDTVLGSTLENLQRQTDIDLVCEGTPTFLLMLDSMVASNPNDQTLLLNATKAFSGYAAALDACDKQERAATVSRKAKIYGLSLLWDCDPFQNDCTVSSSELEHTLAELDSDDVALLFWAGNSWTTWIRHQAGSPESLIQLPQLEKIMRRILELDENYYHGGAHLFLGTYYGSKPPLLGGKPEQSRRHFERALSISNRQFLPALVLYAQTYARTTFDRDLFVNLLQEVIDFPIKSNPDSALVNQVAKRNARKLLKEVDLFFL